MKKSHLIYLLLFLLPAFPGRVAQAQAEKVDKTPSPSRIAEAESLFQKINDANNGLKDYVTNLDIMVKTFGIGLNLKGELYYKEPEKVKLVLKNVPDFLSKHKHIFATKTITGTMRKGFNSRVIGAESLNGAPCWVMEMIPKREGSILSIRLWARKKDSALLKILYHYRDGGVITLNQDFQAEKGFLLPGRSYADIRFPKIQGTIEATYRDYRINTGLSDQIFETS
ncbi:MAG: hypothetical protein HYU64_07355 [Armatimonadetes bacterium]|nr:hypothetical protein [Armatimonadota bacterium]